MGIVSRFSDIIRAVRSTYRNPDVWLRDAMTYGNFNTSGQTVNERTALTVTAYFAAIRNISDDIGTTPIDVCAKRKDGGNDSLSDDPLQWLLNFEPNSIDGMSAASLRSTLTAHALGWHGGFAEIERNGGGEPIGLHLLDPTQVQIWRENATSTIWYIYGPHRIRIAKENVLHLHGLGYDGITGYALAKIQSQAIGTALATMKSRGAFFGNAMVNSGVFSYPGKLEPDQLRNIYESLVKRHQGADNEWNPLILESGLTWTQLSPDPQKSQMIETAYLNIEEICTMFRMPPSKLQHSYRTTNFSGPNAEWGNIEYVMDTLMPWYIRWEQEIKRKMISRRYEPNKYVKHNVASRLRGDSAAQKDYLTGMVFSGLMSRNEARDKIELNPVDDGDEFFINSTMTPIRLALNPPEFTPTAPSTPTQDDSSDMDAEDEAAAGRDVEGIIRAFEPILSECFARILHGELDKVVRASKRDGYYDWRVKFYSEQARYVMLETAHIFSALSYSAPELPDCSKFSKECAERHCKLSLGQIKDAAMSTDLSYWKSTRPQSQAHDEIEHIIKAYRETQAKETAQAAN